MRRKVTLKEVCSGASLPACGRSSFEKRAGSCTPDSVPSVICLAADAAATPARLAPAGIAATGPNPPLPAEPAHLPCSRLDIHLAAVVANDAGRLLPHRFTPDRRASSRPYPSAGILSVAVVVTPPLPMRRPDLLFHQATCPDLHPGRESGSSSTLFRAATDHLPAALGEPPGNRTLNPQLNLLL